MLLLNVEKLLQADPREQARQLADVFQESGSGRSNQDIALLRQLAGQTPPDVPAKLAARWHSLKGRLKEFFEDHHVGRMLPLALSLSENKHCPVDQALEVGPNRHCPPLCRLWRSHLQLLGHRFSEGRVLYTEPIFFWDTEFRCYVRFLDINVDVGDTRTVQGVIQRYLNKQDADRAAGKPPNPYAHRLREKKLLPAYHYAPSGELEAARNIAQCLCELSAVLDGKKEFAHTEISRHVAEDGVERSSTVLIGNRRTNHLISILQPGGNAADLRLAPYRILDDRIEHRSDGLSYYDGKQKEGKYRGENRGFGLITRWQTSSHTITMIAANHAGFSKAASNLLTTDAEQLLSHPAFVGRVLVPPVFQVLISCSFEENFERLGAPEIEEVWVNAPLNPGAVPGPAPA